MKEKQQKIEHRCPCCKRLLFKGKIDFVSMRCPRCKKIVTFR